MLELIARPGEAGAAEARIDHDPLCARCRQPRAIPLFSRHRTSVHLRAADSTQKAPAQRVSPPQSSSRPPPSQPGLRYLSEELPIPPSLPESSRTQTSCRQEFEQTRVLNGSRLCWPAKLLAHVLRFKLCPGPPSPRSASGARGASKGQFSHSLAASTNSRVSGIHLLILREASLKQPREATTTRYVSINHA